MSVARVQTVGKSMKPGECEKCHVELPKGSAYRHFKVGFRSHYKHIRCMKPECTPRPSERESSLLSGVYAAQEEAEDALDAGGFESVDEIEQILADCAAGINEVAGQYSESAEAMGDAGAEMRERAEILESSASDLEGTDLGGDTVDCDACDGTGKVKVNDANETVSAEVDDADAEDCDACDGDGEVPDFDAIIETARAAINDIELP